MAKYQRRVDIQQLSAGERAKLQPGQHVSAGSVKESARGVFLGETWGSTVVAWEGNAAQQPSGRADYIASLRQYAKARA